MGVATTQAARCNFLAACYHGIMILNFSDLPINKNRLNINSSEFKILKIKNTEI